MERRECNNPLPQSKIHVALTSAFDARYTWWFRTAGPWPFFVFAAFDNSSRYSSGQMNLSRTRSISAVLEMLKQAPRYDGLPLNPWRIKDREFSPNFCSRLCASVHF